MNPVDMLLENARQIQAEVGREVDGYVLPPDDPDYGWAMHLRGALKQLSRVESALSGAADRTFQAWADTRFTVEERSRQASEAITAARQVVEEALASAEQSLGHAHRRLLQAILPRRPELDAAGEVRLNGLKQDLKMLLDSVDRSQLVGEIVRLVERYASSGEDPAALWLLAASDWPAMYLASRGAADLAPALERRIFEVLESLGGSAVRKRRQMLRRLQGPHGLQAAITMLRNAADMRLNQLAEVRAAS